MAVEIVMIFDHRWVTLLDDVLRKVAVDGAELPVDQRIAIAVRLDGRGLQVARAGEDGAQVSGGNDLLDDIGRTAGLIRMSGQTRLSHAVADNEPGLMPGGLNLF